MQSKGKLWNHKKTTMEHSKLTSEQLLSSISLLDTKADRQVKLNEDTYKTTLKINLNLKRAADSHTAKLNKIISLYENNCPHI